MLFAKDRTSAVPMLGTNKQFPRKEAKSKVANECMRERERIERKRASGRMKNVATRATSISTKQMNTSKTKANNVAASFNGTVNSIFLHYYGAVRTFRKLETPKRKKKNRSRYQVMKE